jgi:hypothetical protein
VRPELLPPPESNAMKNSLDFVGISLKVFLTVVDALATSGQASSKWLSEFAGLQSSAAFWAASRGVRFPMDAM